MKNDGLVEALKIKILALMCSITNRVVLIHMYTKNLQKINTFYNYCMTLHFIIFQLTVDFSEHLSLN